MNRPNIKFNSSKGFTLLEAVIAFLILSIGMLGIASLQAVSLKAGKSSVYGSVAMMKVEELLENIRANPGNAAMAVYVTAGLGLNNGCSGDASVACDPANMASEDLFWWSQSVGDGLPGDIGTDITTTVSLVPVVAPSNMATVTVSITWNERRSESVGSQSKTYAASSDVCITIPC